MKKQLCLAMLSCIGLSTLVEASPAFTGQDYSGIYECTGDDAHEGKYTGTVTLKLNAAQSTGKYAAYDFKLEVPGYGAYPGHAAGEGSKLAIYFANTDQKTKDYGTGIATVKKGKGGKYSFRKFYYEPEFKGGNYGIEDCNQK